MIRIGHNPNTNMLPMFHFLSREHPLLESITAEPTGHNAMLADGRIDMAPISAFSYGEHWQDYMILPNLSVSTRGRVGSILLFSKVDLKALDGVTVALTDTSATSVNLTKILLHHYYEVAPRYLTVHSDLEGMFDIADAALLIGDAAILEALKNPSCYVYDLGEEWYKHTGFSMTYAVWAFPRKLISERGEEIRSVYRLLLDAKEQALGNMNDIVKTCQTMLGGSSEFWRDYFSQFNYGLDHTYISGLKKYLDSCFEQGLLSSSPVLDFWPED
ncbi:menaquinone biosynthetic enzyme MqnA/MqnD family protein [Desulfosporosinus sp. BICA1-9]|uniref:menaquinone biosynthetic enzyme MqnA/MqnD family protein n=1 Tax=Desulfosporosinus sp. BICA1-9 TaxID=1531958 RepID=UPI00054B1695|nr:menaquinone biosynthesis protein [Desulfosporosinus sp. BICA1-9]KJS50406.1 MAG: ABC transporter substrate-binding protein [Peptococcaceae bacterium BRH_c23]KJS82237.1 MAG: ABC transporter substrate-binding protein [Desulfosporosinus sp. BICA1-9]HBW37969.1 ABC transporter substrate-binding protein [Desulfosporosinus sp.]